MNLNDVIHSYREAQKTLDTAKENYAVATATLERAVCERLLCDPPCDQDDPIEVIFGEWIIKLVPHQYRPKISIRSLPILI